MVSIDSRFAIRAHKQEQTNTNQKQKTHSFEWVSWYLQGSNQGHMDFQSIALPSELRYLANAGANIE